MPIMQQLKAAIVSLKKEEPLSLPAFAQTVSSRLRREIKALSKRNKKDLDFFEVLQDILADFQAHLVALGDSLNHDVNSNIFIALDMLERLCKVSYLHLLLHIIPTSGFCKTRLDFGNPSTAALEI
jgi:hypothetical protein